MPTPTQLRSDIALLVDQASSDLSALWREVETALQVETALRDVLPGLVDAYGAAAATVAADWYDDLRADQGVRGRFSAIPAEVAETGTQALVGWALTEATDLSTFQTLIEGGTQRRIANFSRFTVMDSAIKDPRAAGWKRVGVGACKNGFCDMLIGRGAVYSEATASFQAHDNCQCTAVPAWA